MFENAKPGDKFKARNGEVWEYVGVVDVPHYDFRLRDENRVDFNFMSDGSFLAFLGEAEHDIIDRLTNPINPAHYNDQDVQPIDLIFANGDGPAYCRANIIKYVSRYEQKNGIEDLRKAARYLEWLTAYETDGTVPSDGRET